jgi:hypothetical protein
LCAEVGIEGNYRGREDGRADDIQTSWFEFSCFDQNNYIAPARRCLRTFEIPLTVSTKFTQRVAQIKIKIKDKECPQTEEMHKCLALHLISRFNASRNNTAGGSPLFGSRSNAIVLLSFQGLAPIGRSNDSRDAVYVEVLSDRHMKRGRLGAYFCLRRGESPGA